MRPVKSFVILVLNTFKYLNIVSTQLKIPISGRDETTKENLISKAEII